MKQRDNIFISSYNELKKVRTLTTCAMLISLSVILGYFTVNIGGIAKVGFSSLPVRVVKNLISLPVNVTVFYVLAKAFLPWKSVVYKEV